MQKGKKQLVSGQGQWQGELGLARHLSLSGRDTEKVPTVKYYSRENL
jgi:hypothetical protein